MRMRLSQTRNLVLVALAVAACGSQACSSSTADDVVVAQKTTQASSVSIQLEDSSGNDIGSCAGTLLAEKLVLTAGHCVVGASTWRVEGAGKVVTAQRAVTPWKKFDSSLSHPKHADVALLVLDDAIKLARYPSIADAPLKDGTRATRLHRSASGSKEFIPSDTVVQDGAKKGFGLAYTVEMPKGEWLDTGGALVDGKGKIYGVVSAQGKKSRLLYITRVDGFVEWLSGSVDECGSDSSGLSTRTWGGGWGGSSSGGGGWGGGGGGDWGGYGGDGKKIEAGAPPSSVDGGAGAGGDGGANSGSTNGGSSTGGGASGGTAGTGPGGSNSGSTSSSVPGPNANGEVGAGAGGGATCPAKPPSSSSIPGGGGAGSEGSTGTNGSSSTGAQPGGSTGTGTGGGTGGGTGTGPGTGTGGGGGGGATTGTPGSAGLDEEVCEGADDNPEICPPDTALCAGPGCGGCKGVSGCIDGTMDYGNCACDGAAPLGSPDALR